MSVFSLDPTVGARLRRAVNDDVNISISREQTLRQKKSNEPYPAWNRICALMDRIQDTAEYLSTADIKPHDERRGAFGFLNFMNHACVLLDCINEIARLYDVDLSLYNNSCEVFHNAGRDGTGSDKKYFEYLRSLCSVHPIETSRHPAYQDTDFESCPYVKWNDGWMHAEKSCDLYALVYTNRFGSDHYKTVLIRLPEVYRYIEHRYGLLDEVISPGIEAYKEGFREERRKREIKQENDFNSYTDYVCYLMHEGQDRFGGSFDYQMEYVLKFLTLQFENSKNQIALLKYQNALRRAIHFHRFLLQNMSFEGYSNTGVQYQERCVEDETLLFLLTSPHSESKEAHQYGYAIGVISELYDEDCDSHYYAMANLEVAKPLLEKYVSFEEAKEPFDYFALTQLALYQDSLLSNSALNKNIPNSFEYRIKKLSDAEWEELHREDIHEELSMNKEELEELLKSYGAQILNNGQ